MKQRSWKRWILRRVPLNNYTRRTVYLFLRRQNPNFKTAILRLASGREKHRLVEKEGE